jgi:type III secretion system low calcium response chaperone LcrH/SycD
MTQPAEPPRAPVERVLEGGTWKDVAGLGEAEMEAIYGLAYGQYQQGRFEDADKTFRVLCFHDHRNPRYWLGLGATRQQLKDYEGAIAAYSMLAEMGGNDPLAPLYAAECYIAVGLFDEAIDGLEAALDWAANAQDPQAVIRHVEVLYTALEQLAAAARNAEAAPAAASTAAGSAG